MNLNRFLIGITNDYIVKLHVDKTVLACSVKFARDNYGNRLVLGARTFYQDMDKIVNIFLGVDE